MHRTLRPVLTVHMLSMLVVILWLTGGTGLVNLNTPPVGVVTSYPHLMPPHPDLEEKIEQGLATMPQAMVDGETAEAQGIDQSGPNKVAGVSNLKALPVLVDFSDRPATVTPTFFDRLIFAPPQAGIGSVTDYYNEVSYGQLSITTNNPPSSLGWRRAPQPLSSYVGSDNCTSNLYPNNCQKLAEDVIKSIDAVVDFRQYDNNADGWAEPVLLVHAGRGAEFTGSSSEIWSHSWHLREPYRSNEGVVVYDYVTMPEHWQSVTAANSDMTIGVFAHEMAHGFWGLPDLYDRFDSSYGVGDWSLMGSGSWNGLNGNTPAWPDAWSRIQMGFTTPVVLPYNVNNLRFPSVYNGDPIYSVFLVRNGNLRANEYYLLENRQKISGSYDAALPGSGLLIWHVDEAFNDYSRQNDRECEDPVNSFAFCVENHYLVSLEQADGGYELERRYDQGDANDPFPGGLGRTAFNDTTSPRSRSWYTNADSGINIHSIRGVGEMLTANVYNGIPTQDTTPPNILAIERVGSNPAVSPAVMFKVTFSEAVFNVTTDNFRAVGVNLQGVQISRVWGSGATWWVTISFANGEGSVRLDLYSSTGILDLAGNGMASGSIPFQGQMYTVIRATSFQYLPAIQR